MNDLQEELRPFCDAEIPAAMKRLAADALFIPAAHYVFPNLTPEQAREKILKVNTVYDFQMSWMYYFNKRVIDTTIDKFTSSCDSEFDPSAACLFFSNHRDIILDSSLLQMILVEKGMPTSAITYGNNLIVNQFASDIARSNKMYKVVRDANKRELLLHSRLLSEYLHNSVAQGQSCWIAQRSGRTKDGIDATSPALVKMLSLSTPVHTLSELVDSYYNLHIVPVSVSYEYESCDFLKAQELYHKTMTEHYVKTGDEDMGSMLSGITQWKGNVHIHLGAPLTKEEISAVAAKTSCLMGEAAHQDNSPNAGGSDGADGAVNSAFFNTFCQMLSTHIDSRILKNVKLFPFHFIAHDLRSGTREFKDFYSDAQKECFCKRMEEGTNLSGQLGPMAHTFFLDIYANPVDSAISAGAKLR